VSLVTEYNNGVLGLLRHGGSLWMKRVSCYRVQLWCFGTPQTWGFPLDEACLLLQSTIMAVIIRFCILLRVILNYK
jgi:hypothetical protein